MKNSSYNRILYFIGLVILLTLMIQVYWNYRNYQVGKQQLINEVQISLDNAVDEYYASNARFRTRLTLQNSTHIRGGNAIAPTSSIYLDSSHTLVREMEGRSITVSRDTLRYLSRYEPVEINDAPKLQDLSSITVLRSDTTYRGMESMVGKILYSIKQDTLNLQRLDSLVQAELCRKRIGVDFGLVFQGRGNLEQKTNPRLVEKAPLTTESKSTWLPQHSSLSMHFTNGTVMILKHNMSGILLSAILLGSVIGCLLFLLKIINNQKQLAEVKNDLISNITHEFKTPISTIKVAMEGILNFNRENDAQKTANYVRTSMIQVDKLNNMVEKLLETATLSGSQLNLEKEEVSLVPSLQNLLAKYAAIAPDKSFGFHTDREDILILADPFHLENAFNNILDNAIKYGGQEVYIQLAAKKETVEVIISDSGNSLTKAQADQIFDKFYRVPKGNTHDVKGFGIGLYYTRQIIERHGGSINVEVKKNTNFIIRLPYE